MGRMMSGLSYDRDSMVMVVAYLVPNRGMFTPGLEEQGSQIHLQEPLQLLLVRGSRENSPFNIVYEL